LKNHSAGVGKSDYWASVGQLFRIFYFTLSHHVSLASGIVLLFQTARPGGNFGQVSVINFGIPTWSLSAGLNVLCTLLISYRLWTHQRRLWDISRKSSEYALIAVIFIESAAAYSITGLVYISLFAKALPLQFPLSALWGALTVSLH
jgi:hypothetical protein